MSIKQMMTPGIRPGKSPPFYELGAYVFQELCRDLFDADPGIATCGIYGIPGQPQYGIDLLAHQANGDGTEVGQCKCCENFPPEKIRDASDEFFKYWDDYWSKEKVKRFILLVGSDLNTRQRQDEIIKQIKRFANYGIKYEAWDAAQLRNKLRLHPGIVSSYCTPPDHWVQAICGSGSAQLSNMGNPKQTSIIVDGALLNQNIKLAERLSTDTERDLEQMRLTLREGQKNKPVKWIRDVKNDDTLWPILSSQVKGKILLFEANLQLNGTGNLDQVKRLADEIRELAPSIDQTRLRALIAYKEDDTDTALRLLANQHDIESLNLKAAILLETGRIDECRAILNFGDQRLDGNT